MNTTESAAAVSGDPAAAAIMIQTKMTGSSLPSGRSRPPCRGRGTDGTICAAGTGRGCCSRSAPSTGSTGRSAVSSRRSAQVFEAYAVEVARQPHQAVGVDATQVRLHEAARDRLGVGDRIDTSLHMGHVVILEAAKHIGDCVDLADIGQELVAEPLAF